MGKDLERLKQHFPLLEYLQRHHWTGRPVGNGSEFVGLCPLHEENHPSFYVNPHKNLFYCHGCGRGGDLIRFVELSLHLSFPQSISYLRPHCGLLSTPTVPSSRSRTLLAATRTARSSGDRRTGHRLCPRRNTALSP